MGQASAIPAHLIEYAAQAEQADTAINALVPPIQDASRMFSSRLLGFPVASAIPQAVAQIAADLGTYSASCRVTDEQVRRVAQAFIAADSGGLNTPSDGAAVVAELLAEIVPGLFGAKLTASDADLATQMQYVRAFDARQAAADQQQQKRSEQEARSEAEGKAFADSINSAGAYAEQTEIELKQHAGDPEFGYFMQGLLYELDPKILESIVGPTAWLDGGGMFSVFTRGLVSAYATANVPAWVTQDLIESAKTDGPGLYNVNEWFASAIASNPAAAANFVLSLTPNQLSDWVGREYNLASNTAPMATAAGYALAQQLTVFPDPRDIPNLAQLIALSQASPDSVSAIDGAMAKSAISSLPVDGSHESILAWATQVGTFAGQYGSAHAQYVGNADEHRNAVIDGLAGIGMDGVDAAVLDKMGALVQGGAGQGVDFAAAQVHYDALKDFEKATYDQRAAAGYATLQALLATGMVRDASGTAPTLSELLASYDQVNSGAAGSYDKYMVYSWQPAAPGEPPRLVSTGDSVAQLLDRIGGAFTAAG
jgi:hypothetical protein